MTTLAAYWYQEDQNEPSRLVFLTMPGVDLVAELSQLYLENYGDDEEGYIPEVKVEKDNHYAEYALSDGDGLWLFASTVGYVSPLPV